MDWKDIYTEILIKIKLKDPSKLKRRKGFLRHDYKEVIATTTIIKSRLIDEINNRLHNRAVTASYLTTDNRIFEPFVEFLLINLNGRELSSFTFEIGSDILKIVKEYEHINRIHVNKSHLYFGLALNSVNLNSTINASIYWELSQKEEANTLRNHFIPTTSLLTTIEKFSTIISGIEWGLKENSFYEFMRNTYPFVGDFKSNLQLMADPQIFSYFSSGIRNRAVGYWVKYVFTDMTKMYSQELINALCILFESLLKLKPLVTNDTLGKIMNHDLVNLNPNISAIVGHNRPAPSTGLCSAYPQSAFDTSFSAIINAILNNALPADDLKAHVFYGMYLLRNKSLHGFNPATCYNNNPILMENTLGFAFSSIPIVMSL